MLKSNEEIQKIHRASAMVAETLTMIGAHVQPGITTEKLDDICHEYITETLGATPACLGYKGYPKSTCTSVNHVICHGIPSHKTLKEGDILNIDITVEYDGYHGDSAKMFFVGKPSIMANRLVTATQECLLQRYRASHTG